MRNRNYLSPINFRKKTFLLMNTMLEVQIFFGTFKKNLNLHHRVHL